MNREVLKNLSESEAWQQAKQYLVLYVEKLDRVSEPLIIDGITITPEHAYLGKLLAVRTIHDFMDSVDSFKNNEERENDSRDSME